MKKKTTILIILTVVLFVAVASGIYFVFSKKSVSQSINNQTRVAQKELSPNGCLKENEVVEYDRVSLIPEVTQPKEISPTIFVKDKKTGDIKNSFQIENVLAVGHVMEVHRCGMYVIRGFELDQKKGIYKKNEFWKYAYNGEGKVLMSSEEFKPYSFDFRIDSKEKYISLVRWYLGKDDYVLVIKDLKTLNDTFVLLVADIVKQNPDVAGDISFYPGGWTSDGKYFWANVFVGADVYGFVRINTKDWTYKVFPTPQRTMGGDAFNINNGMITYGENTAPWSGVFEIDEQLKKEALQRRQISSFYIYNLFTKQKYLIATMTDPTYYFRPQWLSDTELQYELPNGEKKIYKNLFNI